MLTGVIKYKGHIYKVKGVSTDQSLTLYISQGTASGLQFLGSYAERPFVVSITDLAINVAVTKSTPTVGRAKVLDEVNEEFYRILAGTLKQLSMRYTTGEVHFKDKTHTIKKFRYKDKLAYLGYNLAKITVVKYKYNDFYIHLKEDEQPMTAELKQYYYQGDAKKRILYTAQVADLLLEGKIVPTKKKKKKKDDDGLTENGKDFVNINLFHHTVNDVLRHTSNKEQFNWLLQRRYIMVSDETMESTLAYLSQFPILAVDTETTGLNITHHMHTAPDKADKLVGIVISGREGESFYFPLAHQAHFDYYDPNVAMDPTYDPMVAKPTSIRNLMGGNIKAFFDLTKDFFEKKDFVTFNASFDWKVFYGYYIKLNVVFDVYAAFMLTLTAANHYKTNNLKVWTSRVLDRVSLELSNYSKTGKWTNEMAFSFKDLPYEMVRLYACPDSDNTLGLYNYIMNNNIINEYSTYELVAIETKFMIAVAYQEFYGHYISPEKLSRLKIDLEADKKATLMQFLSLVAAEGIDTTGLNIDSSQQMIKLFYTDLKYPPMYDSKTKNLTASKKVLGRLVSEGVEPEQQKYPILAYFFRYKDSAKLLSDFKKTLEDDEYDGYLYSKVTQFLNTGRISVKGPNYQSYSDRAKQYVEGRPGYYVMDYDYNSIESRIIASMSGEPYLLEAFKDIDIDYHKLQAAKLFSKPYELVSKKLRKQAKALNFGIPYGLGDAKLGEAIFGMESKENSANAKRLKNEYFKIQPYVQNYFVSNRAQGVQKRYTATHFGRRRYYPHDQPNYKVELAAGNQPIQGTAADMFKKAVGKIMQYILDNNLQGKILLPAFVHDECVLEIANDINPLEVLKFVKPIVEEPIPSFVPILIGCGFGHNWYNAKSVEIPVMLQEDMLAQPGNYFPNWPAELPNVTDVIAGYIHEHELQRIAQFVTNPDNEGNVMKAVIHDYYLDKLKAAGIKEDTTKPIEEMLKLLWQKYNLSRYADFGQVVRVLRPSELEAAVAAEEPAEVDKLARSILLMNVVLDTNAGTVFLNKKDTTIKDIVQLIKAYAVVGGTGYSIHLATEQPTSTPANPQVVVQRVDKYRIPAAKIHEFVGKAMAAY